MSQISQTTLDKITFTTAPPEVAARIIGNTSNLILEKLQNLSEIDYLLDGHTSHRAPCGDYW